MDKELIIKTESLTYPIRIGQDLQQSLKVFLNARKFSKLVCLIDVNVAKSWDLNLTNLEMIKVSEATKNIETIGRIWQIMQEQKMDRKSLLVNIGGGVLCDLGGFAASTYMRGIDFVNCPTTLLSMVDASVGGKVGFNFGGIKNLIGSFEQPQAVLIDVNFLETLPKEHITSGLGEMVKHGLIKSEKYIQELLAEPKDWAKLIYESCRIKAEVVMSDEKELGPRKILNFGHTVGHALELLSYTTNKPLLHGEAVAIGMIVESKISELAGKITSGDFQEINKTIKLLGLPVNCSKSDYPKTEIFKKMREDKKNANGKIKWTLLKAIGSAEYDIEVSDELVDQALNYILV